MCYRVPGAVLAGKGKVVVDVCLGGGADAGVRVFVRKSISCTSSITTSMVRG